jgi:hypothetical protein
MAWPAVTWSRGSSASAAASSAVTATNVSGFGGATSTRKKPTSVRLATLPSLARWSTCSTGIPQSSAAIEGATQQDMAFIP